MSEYERGWQEAMAQAVEAITNPKDDLSLQETLRLLQPDNGESLAERDKRVARECAVMADRERLNQGAAVVGKDYSKGYGDGAGATAATIRQRWGL